MTLCRTIGFALIALTTSVTVAAKDAKPPILPMSETEQNAPELPDILSMKDRAEVIDRILAERLDTVIPQIMREEGIDLWLMMSREYFEEPVVKSMLDAKSMAARRRTILIFHDRGDGQPIERLTVSRYGLAGLFEPSWDPEEQPDQWKAVADIIAERDPAKIAINYSDITAFGDGMTLSQYRAMTSALAPKYTDRIGSGETLSIRWLETRIPSEMEIYPGIVRIAHALIGEAFSRKVITPGETTAADVQWWYREKLAGLGLTPWFHPSIGIQRQGATGMLRGDTVIQHGDLLWTDFGITYLRLNTDTQHLAYVLRPGETEAPKGLVQGLANTNRVQDILTSHFRVGDSGNEVLARSRSQAIAEGLDPSIYSHPIGSHGHGAGTAIGFWDNQEADPRGEYRIQPNTAWSIELTTYSKVPEWGGQRVDFRSEEDAFFDGKTVRYLDGRQTELTLIGVLPENRMQAPSKQEVASYITENWDGIATRFARSSQPRNEAHTLDQIHSIECEPYLDQWFNCEIAVTLAHDNQTASKELIQTTFGRDFENQLQSVIVMRHGRKRAAPIDLVPVETPTIPAKPD